MKPGLWDDDSMIRRVNRENVLLLGGGRALLMQLAHPKVAAGVDEHSDFRQRPIRRLRRTIRMIMAVVFGDRQTALGAARSINHVHGRVRGEGYSAQDPDLLLWVHATLVDTSLVAYETFVRRLSPSDAEAFYQEMKSLGELLGIPAEKFPASLADFNDYMDSAMSGGPVRVGRLARGLAEHVLRPRLRLVPGGALIPMEIVTTGLLPPTLREQYGLAWGPPQERFYRLVVKAVPRLIAVTPPILRVWPLPGHNVKLAPSFSLGASR